MSFESYFEKFEDQLTDFWGRRSNAPVHTRTIRIFGRPVTLACNTEAVLQSADFSLPLYSSAPAIDDRQFHIEIVVRPFHPSPGPLPDNLFDHIQYSGHAQWLTMHIGGWGHCHVDLAAGKALVVISTELGSRPDFISRFILNTILNNFMKTIGLGFLHTTAVYLGGRILLMLADHNSGKSTTALHLTLNGYAFVSDSQIYIEYGELEERPKLYGYPVGRAKLRGDMLSNFPRLATFLESEPVRRETKFRLDLHRVDPALVHDGAIQPEKVLLCLLRRNGRRKTILSPAAKSETLEAAVVNSLFYDEAASWRANFKQIERLIQYADCYHLSIGQGVSDIIRVVDGLMS